MKFGLCMNSTPLGKSNAFARIRFSPTTSFTKLSVHWVDHPARARGLYCQCGWQSTDDEFDLPGDQFDAHVCVETAGEPTVRSPRSPWYDGATIDLTPEQVASEYDLSYEKSIRGRGVRSVRRGRACVGECGRHFAQTDWEACGRLPSGIPPGRARSEPRDRGGDGLRRGRSRPPWCSARWWTRRHSGSGG